MQIFGLFSSSVQHIMAFGDRRRYMCTKEYLFIYVVASASEEYVRDMASLSCQPYVRHDREMQRLPRRLTAPRSDGACDLFLGVIGRK